FVLDPPRVVPGPAGRLRSAGLEALVGALGEEDVGAALLVQEENAALEVLDLADEAALAPGGPPQRLADAAIAPGFAEGAGWDEEAGRRRGGSRQRVALAPRVHLDGPEAVRGDEREDEVLIAAQEEHAAPERL